MRKIIFDLDVLRSFVTGMELGSFAKAADRLGRSTSAISAQLKKLEEQAGTPIFRKAGRGLALTEAGETMLAYARRLLDLNDEAATAIHGADLEGGCASACRRISARRSCRRCLAASPAHIRRCGSRRAWSEMRS